MQSVVRSSFIGLLAIAGLTACGDKVTQIQQDNVVHGVTVTPSVVNNLAVGTSITLSASVDAGAGVSDRTVAWSTSDATVASVDAATGKVTGVKAGGPVTITATSNADHAVSGAAVITVVAAGGVSPTVTISNINQTVCGVVVVGQPPICSSVPATLTNVNGQLDVTLNVDAQGQALKSVTAYLKCGTDSVGQTANYSGDVAELGAEAAAAPVTLSFNTAEFSPAGVVKLHNGQCTIGAAATTASGTQSATTTQVFTLNNADIAIINVSSTNSATGPDAKPWIGGGPLTITAIPVMYSGRTPVSATIGLTGGTPTTGATAPNPTSQTVTTLSSGAFSATWSIGSAAPTVRGYAATGVTPTVSVSDASGQTLTTIGTVTVKGGTTTTTPANFAFNLDEQKPLPGTFSVTNNPDQNIIAPSGQGYVGSTFRFVADSAAGYRGPATDIGPGAQTANTDRGGVDKVTVVFQYRTAGSGSYTTITDASSIAESVTSQTYELRMITMDALGNADTTASASTIKFGVDRTAPTNVAAAAPANQSTTITNGSLGNYTFTISDNLSGTGPALVAQVRQWNGLSSVNSGNEGRINTNATVPVGSGLTFNAVGSSATSAQNPCYIGRFNAAQANAGANAIPVLSATGTTIGYCTPVIYDLSAGTLAATQGVDGYWYTTVVATDVAGNQAAPFSRVVLEDATAPTVNNIDLPATAVGNSTVSFPASVTDSASASVGDIIGSWITQTFAGPAVSLRWPTTTGPGVAFDNVLTKTTTVTPTIPNFIKNLQVAPTTSVPAAGGNVTSVTVTAVGAAQNTGSLTATFAVGLPQLVNGASSTFTASSIPTDWSIQAPANANVSNCVNDTCTGGATQPTSITLTVTATGPSATYTNPFATGTVEFWYRPAGNPVWYLIGNAGAASSRDNGTNRFWDFSISFNPPNFTPDQVALTTNASTIEVVAIGVNANGDAIMTAPVTLTVANP